MVLVIFIDGLGAGQDDPGQNPLAARPGILTRFTDGRGPPLPSGGRVQLADATLGVPGRPQSATGQTTLLTGQNAARLLGRHLVGFPNAALRGLLEADNLFLRLASEGRRVAFLNAYHRPWLEALGLPHDPARRVVEGPMAIPRRLARPAATTTAAHAAGLRLRTFDDVLEGRALYHDFTNGWPRGRGLDLPAFTPEEAGARLAEAASPYDFALFEYFLSDLAGHGGDPAVARGVVDGLHRFVGACLDATDLERRHVLVISDHGNLEDLSIRTHTQNPVPLFAFGPKAPLVQALGDLTGVYGLVRALSAP